MSNRTRPIHEKFWIARFCFYAKTQLDSSFLSFSLLMKKKKRLNTFEKHFRNAGKYHIILVYFWKIFFIVFNLFFFFIKREKERKCNIRLYRLPCSAFGGADPYFYGASSDRRRRNMLAFISIVKSQQAFYHYFPDSSSFFSFLVSFKRILYYMVLHTFENAKLFHLVNSVYHWTFLFLQLYLSFSLFISERKREKMQHSFAFFCIVCRFATSSDSGGRPIYTNKMRSEEWGVRSGFGLKKKKYKSFFFLRE